MDSPLTYDSMLILLPGSSTDEAAVDCLSGIAKIDRYLARIKLNSILPVPLCRCMRSEFLQDNEHLLNSSGIRFIVLDMNFYNAPFQSVSVSTCSLEDQSCRFCDTQGVSYEISPGTDVLLLEAAYHTNIKDRFISFPNLDAGVDLGSASSKEKISNVLESFRVLFLYRKSDPVPLSLIDMCLDYRFLGGLKAISAAANFNILKDKFESMFNKKINRNMVTLGFSLVQSFDANELSKKLKKKKRKEKVTIKTSNEDAVHLMSRLMYAQWCMEPGSE